MVEQEMSVAEMDQEYAAPLPHRDLLVAVSLLGIPLVGLDGVTVNVNTAGPHWLA